MVHLAEICDTIVSHLENNCIMHPNGMVTWEKYQYLMME